MKSLKMLILAAFTILSVSVVAQDTTKHKAKMKKHKMEQVKYSCPMHPDEVSNKPGQCSRCGMDLTKSKKEQEKMEVMKIYTCPMHPEVAAKKLGKCPKCGMALEEKKDEKSNYKMKM